MRRMVGDSVGILKRTTAAHFNLSRIWTLSLRWIAGFDRQMICSCNAVFALAEPLGSVAARWSADLSPPSSPLDFDTTGFQP